MYTKIEIQNFAETCFNMNETQLQNAITNYYTHGVIENRAVALAVGLAYE